MCRENERYDISIFVSVVLEFKNKQKRNMNLLLVDLVKKTALQLECRILTTIGLVVTLGQILKQLKKQVSELELSLDTIE